MAHHAGLGTCGNPCDMGIGGSRGDDMDGQFPTEPACTRTHNSDH